MNKGLSLMEFLLYAAIFIIVTSLLIGILLTGGQIYQRQTAGAEVTNQLNFVSQTIHRLVRESSAIIVNGDVNTDEETDDAIGSPHPRLVLRMSDSAGGPSDRDPVVITTEDNGSGVNVVKISEGDNPAQELSSDRVDANNLQFTKSRNTDGHDTVAIDISMTYVSNNPKSQITRTLASAIARVSAATFDDNIVPGTGGPFNVGLNGTPWGQIIVAAGNAGTPSYTFDGTSIDSGFFSPAEDEIAAATEGSERLRIDAAGNVGVGTALPQSLLHVSGGDIHVDNTQLVAFRNAGGGGIAGDILANSSDDLQLRTSGNARVTITDTGNVGINTTAPNSSALLELNSTSQGFLMPRMTSAQRTAISGPITGLMVYNTSSSTVDVYNGSKWGPQNGHWAANGTAIYNTNGGNVGIGVTNPNQPLEIETSVSTQGLYIGNKSIPYGALLANPTNLQLYPNASGNATFQVVNHVTHGLPVFQIDTIDGAWETGGGTLFLGGETTVQPQIGTQDALIIQPDNVTSFTGKYLSIFDKSGTSLMELVNSGNLGIGTADPGADKLDVRGRAYASGGWQTTDADYAEWFEKEQETNPGDVIGINPSTGKAKRYSPGDLLVGVHSLKPGVVGNRLYESDEEMEKNHVLVALLGQVYVNESQTKIKEGKLYTLDDQYIGIALSNGKVLIGR